MKEEPACPRCGQRIPFGQNTCPVCSTRWAFFWKLERETLILVSFGLLAIFFVVTGFAARNYHARQKALAAEWYRRGEAALQAGQAREAVADFHNALNYSRNSDLDLLRLAEALIQEGHLDEAHAYLRTLWDREPGDGEINLNLARLAARQGHISDAIRYYHNAIYGVWVRDALVRRREVRMELTQLLLREGMKAHADSELITMADGLPEDAALHTQTGEMFMQVQDYPHALQEFEHAIRFDRRQKAAWAGAGEAAFQLGRYRDAERFLERVVTRQSEDSLPAQWLEISRLVLASDPFQPRLAQRERVQRVIMAFHHALARLQACAQTRGVNLSGSGAPNPLQGTYAQALKLKPDAIAWKLLREPDLLTPIMDAVSTLEDTTTQVCGGGTALDQALLLITRKRGVSEP